MIIIRFADEGSKRKALGQLAGWFSFKSWASGEMMLPKEALALLAEEEIRVAVEGRATGVLPKLQRAGENAVSADRRLDHHLSH